MNDVLVSVVTDPPDVDMNVTVADVEVVVESVVPLGVEGPPGVMHAAMPLVLDVPTRTLSIDEEAFDSAAMAAAAVVVAEERDRALGVEAGKASKVYVDEQDDALAASIAALPTVAYVNEQDALTLAEAQDDIADAVVAAAFDATAKADAARTDAEAYADAQAALLIPQTEKDAPLGVPALDEDSLLRDAAIPPSIARDAEVTAAIAAEVAARNAAITAAVNALVAGAPDLLNTLLEISAAVGDDPNFAADVMAALATKVDKSAYNANTILAANVDDTPFPLDVAASTVVGRKAAGGIVSMTMAELKTLLAIVAGDVGGLGTAAVANVGDFDVAGAAATAAAASQPHNAANLDPIAALTSTVFGRAILELANAAALRAAAGLGALATLSTITSAQIDDGTIVDGDVAAANKDGTAGTYSMRTLGDGAAQAAQGSKRARVLAEVHAAAGGANSAAEQTLATLLVPGGTIAVGDKLVLVAMGDCLNNSGGSLTIQFRLKLGATTVLDTTALNLLTSANRRRWWCEVTFMFPTVASQVIGGPIMLANTSTISSWQGGTGAPLLNEVGGNTAAEDMTTDKNVVLTAQLQSNLATLDVFLRAASLELVKK